MARKKKKEKKSFEKLPFSKRRIIAITLTTVGLVLLLGLAGIAGKGGDFLAQGLRFAFGWGAWFFPFILFLISFFSLRFHIIKERRAKPSLSKQPGFGARVFSLFAMLLMFSTVFHISYLNKASALKEAIGGGYIGYGISYVLVNTFGNIATWIICIGALLILLIIVFTGALDPKTKKKIAGIFKVNKKRLEQRQVQKAKKKKRQTSNLAAASSQKQEPENKKQALKKKDSGFTSFQTKSDSSVTIPLDLLESKSEKPNAGDIKGNRLIIKNTLENFSIPVEMGEIKSGPTVTQYTLRPEEGIKLSKITTLQNDLSMALAAHPIRIEAPIPGRSLVGIEVPNQKIATIRLREILASPEFKNSKSDLTVGLGKDVTGKEWLADLAKMPHLLVAGATGSGKTVFLNSVIIGLLFENTPKDLRLILVDPKRVELTLYEGIPHLLTHVITDAQKTVNALKWAIKEMEDRFDILSKAKKRNIDSYNKSVNEEDKLPYIVIVIDELADLMSTSPQEVENAIVRLAQMARATGIHLIMATQRPSVDVITGLIKANVTSRVAFSVASSTDSRTILDFSGAEKLLGKGDMLYVSANLSKPKRLQGAYVSDEEIKKIVNHLKGELPPDYNEEVTDIPEMEKESGLGDLKEDEMLPRARELVIQSGKASASYLQRRLRVGYARAARLIDLLEEEGTIGPRKGNKAREVLVSNQENEYQEDEDELETDEFEKGGEDLEDEEDN